MAGRPEIIGLPRFIFGQSMGGAVALKALLKDPHEWDGIVLVAPMCKVIQSLTTQAERLMIFISFNICRLNLILWHIMVEFGSWNHLLPVFSFLFS